MTWAREGKKRIVWRCVSQLEFGTKYCHASPTLDEDKLHSAILNALECKKILGVSAPTSAGKSYVIQLDTARKMLKEKLDVIYIVPTLSLLNQVVEDYHVLLTQVGITDYIITSNLMIGESKAAHMIMNNGCEKVY